MKNIKSLILKYSSILLVGYLIEWWFFWYAPLNIPEKIPAIPVKTEGLVLGGLHLTVFILALKRFLNENPETNIFKLTILGTIICFIPEIIFQIIRQFSLNADTFNERLHYFLLGTIGVTIFGTVLSFFVAFQLKTKKTGQLILMWIGFGIAVSILRYFFPTLLGQ